MGREESIRMAESKKTEVPFVAGAVSRIRVQYMPSEFSAMLRAEVKINIQSQALLWKYWLTIYYCK